MVEAGLVGPAVALGLFLACTIIHFRALRACNVWLLRLRRPQSSGVMLAVIVAFASHVAQIALFAAGYRLLIHWGLGAIQGLPDATAPALMYFSTETYSSLGFGDLLPRGELRLIAGIEALVGLVMIAWTASFTYLEMSRHWAGGVTPPADSRPPSP